MSLVIKLCIYSKSFQAGFFRQILIKKINYIGLESGSDWVKVNAHFTEGNENWTNLSEEIIMEMSLHNMCGSRN